MGPRLRHDGRMTDRSTAFTTRLDWLLFILLGFFWGSSYLFIKIAADAGVQPLTIVTFRLAIGFALVAVLAIASRERMPRSLRTYGHLLVLAALSMAIPFTLISWAEQTVDSALAAAVNGAIPLCVIVIAALVLPDEPFTLQRIVGLLAGFVGVAILVGFDPGVLAGTSTGEVAALLGSTVSYAAGGVYARRFLRDLRPKTVTMFELGFALLLIAPVAMLVDGPIGLPARLDAVVAVTWLGLIGSGIAFLTFFRLLSRWGATRTSMVAYLMPVNGVILGALVLGEPVDARLVVGLALVISGIAVVQLRLGPAGVLRALRASRSA
jgi:drug/metabolite transporter (DMT)-like permease